MFSISRRDTLKAIAALGAGSLVQLSAYAQLEKEKLCGATALTWVSDIAHAATDRLGNKLMFGEPLATLDYSNDLFAISLLRLSARTGDLAMRDYGENIVSSFVADDGSIKRVPERGFRLDAMPAGVVLLDVF